MLTKIDPPATNEYSSFYSDYVQRAQAKDVLALLPQQIDNIKSALGHLSDAQALFRDAPQEWSIKQVVGHMNDVERIFSYRLLRISRGDETPLPGFEQNDYVAAAGFDEHPFKDLLQEFEYLRRANILAIHNMTSESIARMGTASGNPISARALIYMLAGHVEHHMQSLHEKYLPGLK